jgi:ribosomal protein L11 methyltransferase
MNGPPATTTLSIARLRAPAGLAPILAEAFAAREPAPLAVTTIPADEGPWTVEALFAEAPDPAALSAALNAVVEVDALPERDWVAESLRGLGAVRAGRFRVVGGHLAAPNNWSTLRLEAGPAFGSGHHETTQGCLRALDWLARQQAPGRVLDLGCGSGVLALAAARLGAQAVMATDIDPVAVRTAAANARSNRVAGAVRTLCSVGFDTIPPGARFDLILANILAEPLKALAPDMRDRVAEGGRIVLSGLLRRQEASVRAVYRAHGFTMVRRFVLGQWPTLVLRRG